MAPNPPQSGPDNWYLLSLVFLVPLLFGTLFSHPLYNIFVPCSFLPSHCAPLPIVYNGIWLHGTSSEGAYKIEIDMGNCQSIIYNGTVEAQLYIPANSTRARSSTVPPPPPRPIYTALDTFMNTAMLTYFLVHCSHSIGRLTIVRSNFAQGAKREEDLYLFTPYHAWLTRCIRWQHGRRYTLLTVQTRRWRA